MARQLTTRDLITAIQQPVAVLAPAKPGTVSAPVEEGLGAEFFMGQVAAVVSMARTNALNYREAVKQIETIVHNYEKKQ